MQKTQGFDENKSWRMCSSYTGWLLIWTKHLKLKFSKMQKYHSNLYEYIYSAFVKLGKSPDTQNV